MPVMQDSSLLRQGLAPRPSSLTVGGMAQEKRDVSALAVLSMHLLHQSLILVQCI